MLANIDIMVLLKLCVKKSQPWGQSQLAAELHISQSSVNSSLKHAELVKLYTPTKRAVNTVALEEALVHGAKYFLAPIRGGITRGFPTAWAAAPFSDQISTSDELPPVWPDANGTVRGVAFEPIYKSAPHAAMDDPALYELLAIVDVLRDGRARESTLAIKELQKRLKGL